MIIFKKAADIHNFLADKMNKNLSIGFVPTMGALHEGHISLINKSKSANSLTVCSIFVNPTQFNNPLDFEKYPITIESDISMLEEAECDALFLPSTNEIYPEDFVKIHYEIGYLETILEGKYRPGHFQGVCMVVERLLRIIPCNKLYLGQKDYQQCMIIDKMISLRNLDVELIIAPTVRESDGLAMSSRNRRLSFEERKKATVIFEALLKMKSQIRDEAFHMILSEANEMITEKGFEVDYIALTDSGLVSLEKADQTNGVVALIAATINNIRLIDNMTLINPAN
jgi:pantoate--beta-alanine ligase